MYFRSINETNVLNCAEDNVITRETSNESRKPGARGQKLIKQLGRIIADIIGYTLAKKAYSIFSRESSPIRTKCAHRNEASRNEILQMLEREEVV